MNENVNVLLVHGAWADGSCWAKVIPLLQSHGFNVTAAQIPLTSLDDDTAVTRRLLSMQTGPTVLVGHSYGGRRDHRSGHERVQRQGPRLHHGVRP